MASERNPGSVRVAAGIGFRVGDVVRHRSGGPQLAVTGLQIGAGAQVWVECVYLLGPKRGHYAEILFRREAIELLWRHPVPEA